MIISLCPPETGNRVARRVRIRKKRNLQVVNCGFLYKIRHLCRILIVSCFCLSSYAQTGGVTIVGTVEDQDRQPLSSASVHIPDLGKSASTNAGGRFELRGLPAGTFEIQISMTGHVPLKTRIGVKLRNQPFLFTLKADTVSLEAVTVFGYTPTQLVNRQAYNVTAVDAQKLHNSTSDIAHVLDRIPGARLRETGGVGSDYDFSINGFSGKRIRFFLDGVPMDHFGASFQINNIPINFAERVEVYKGVVPVWLGSDALGGAVNIITGNGMKNYLDVSYAYGSFNTHRSNLNAAVTSKNGFTVQLNAFRNYSDNDYKVTVDAADIHTGKYHPNTRVRRFHDTYHNETAIAQLGFVDKKWAGKFLIGITLGRYYREIQTGASMVTVFGAWHTKGDIVMPALKYQKKDLLIKGLDVAVNANYNFGREQNIDTVHARYNWFADSITYRGKGGESSNLGHFKYSNNAANTTATLSYRINGRHYLALNDVFSHFDRKGHDSFYPDDSDHRIPQKTDKNILGFSYQYAAPDKWNATIFGKYLYQRARTVLVKTSVLSPDTTFVDAGINRNKFGYGLAASYYILPGLQLKGSYERAYRLPESEDIFGDLVNRQGNWNVQPEYSNNVNIGFSYWLRLRKDHRFYFNANGIYYHARDYMVQTFNASQSRLMTSNYYTASNVGAEGELRYSYKQVLNAGFNLTCQNIRDRQKNLDDPFSGSVLPNYNYRERIPNIPYLFGNTDASVLVKNVFSGGDRLTLGYNLLYMHSFYLYSVTQGAASSKLGVPEQWSHEVNVVYTLKDGRYNVGLEGKNLTDAKLYDNFSLQKPGRAFYIKLRYFINKK